MAKYRCIKPTLFKGDYCSAGRVVESDQPLGKCFKEIDAGAAVTVVPAVKPVPEAALLDAQQADTTAQIAQSDTVAAKRSRKKKTV